MFQRFRAYLFPALLLLIASAPAFGAERVTGPLLRGAALESAAASMLADIGQATWVRDGKSARAIYVFFDPNCPFCRTVYDGLRAEVDMGEVELRWIPIGVLMATSPGKAAAILEARDPTAALHRNEHNFSTETGSFGGIEEEPAPRDDTLARLERNLALLRRSGMDAVPALLYRSKDGRAHFVVGAPPRPALERILKELQ